MLFTKDLDGFFDETVNEISLESLAKKVEDSILEILVKTHKDSRKHRFHKRAKSIQFPCPICGDSSEDASKMRGHIYLGYGLYKCYNNNNCSCSLNDFFRRFDLDNLFSHAELAELERVAVNSRSELYRERQSIAMAEHEELFPLLFDRDEIKNIFDAIDITTDKYAFGKIAPRQIPKWKHDFLLWEPLEQCLYILNMHEGTKKVINFQKRPMRQGYTGPKYMTVSYSDLLAIKHDMRHKFRQPRDSNGHPMEIPLEDIAEKSGVPVEFIKKFNITGQYFNILNVSWGDDIYVFEGPIDSFFMPNSIALAGTGADLKHPTFNYIFDDDEPGRKEAYKRLDNREPVFTWKRFLRENPEYKKPYVKKRDFNDMFMIKPFSHQFMAKYFTNNPLYKLDV